MNNLAIQPLHAGGVTLFYSKFTPGIVNVLVQVVNAIPGLVACGATIPALLFGPLTFHAYT